MFSYLSGLRAQSAASLRFHFSNTQNTNSNSSSTNPASSSGGTSTTTSSAATHIASNNNTHALPWTSVSISVPVFLVVALTVLVVTCCGAVAIVMVTCCGARRRDTVAEGGDARWLPGVGIIDYVPASNRSSVRTSVILCDSDPGGSDGPPSQEPAEDASTVFNIRLPASPSSHPHPPHSYSAHQMNQQALRQERTQPLHSMPALRQASSLVPRSTSLVLDPLRPYVQCSLAQGGGVQAAKTQEQWSESEALLEDEGSPLSPRENAIGTVETVKNDADPKSSSVTEPLCKPSTQSPGREPSCPQQSTHSSPQLGIRSRTICHTFRMTSPSARLSSSTSSPSSSTSLNKASPLTSPRLATSSSQHPSDFLPPEGGAKKGGPPSKEDVVLPLRRDLENFTFRSLSIPALGGDLESSGRPVRHSSSGIPLEWVRIINY